ncbi:CRISPR-associated endoribonuclease Cas6 [Tissierella sp. MSJ-40]|uniref:CRISPR-associated endoribonuclease Cas6 n=1 Tax=Tissierella simiarum TaxID=2841534 RepID=A0ABS6EB93_9FIRM|nr:CRISPR-associated endoribonuclease Cas6 [Tissierella simiarum]MBU5439705.1 CRISPR-associated endoribonuclease Cas6 [Tissierella simiarum]
MNYYELTCTVYLLNNIYFDKVNEEIGNHINRSMLLDNDLSNVHKRKGYKYYVFDTLYPRESDKTYKGGRVYIFRIRSIDKELISKIKNVITKDISGNLKILSTELKTHKNIFVTELYNVTPAVLTIDNRFWVKGDSLELLERRIQENLIKKYQDYYGENIETKESFIQGIELRNNKAIGLRYKSIRLMGNKFRILVKEDDISQKLAFMTLGTGLLEKNSSNGMGFCIGK